MRQNLIDRMLIAGGFVCLALTAGWVGLARGRPAPPAGQAFAQATGTAAAAGAPRIAIVFQLEDCGTQVEALSAWNAVAAAGALEVRGLVLGAQSDAEAARALRGSGIRFPAHAERDGRFRGVLASLGYTQTPVAVVLDAAGRVRMTTPLADVRPRDAVRQVTGFAESLRAAPAGG